jgi:hypothetical protein
MDGLIGMLALLGGVALALTGLRLFFLLLPYAAFVTGFVAGAGLVTWIFGDRFLATALGIIVGVMVGFAFALISWLSWYIGVILGAASTGAVLAAGLFAAFGLDNGWILLFLGAIGAALFASAAFAFNDPVYLVIFTTAFQGATLAVAGILLVLNRIDRHELASTRVWGRINDHWILWVLWIAAAAVGLGSQLQLARSFTLPGRRWEKASQA